MVWLYNGQQLRHDCAAQCALSLDGAYRVRPKKWKMPPTTVIPATPKLTIRKMSEISIVRLIGGECFRRRRCCNVEWKRSWEVKDVAAWEDEYNGGYVLQGGRLGTKEVPATVSTTCDVTPAASATANS